MYFSALLMQPVGPKASPGVAVPDTSTQQPPAPSGQQQHEGGNVWVMMAPILVVMVVMLFMNRTQRKKDAEVRSKLKKGDRVVSQSGLIGDFVEIINDREARVQLAPGTKVSMLISSLSPFEAATSKADDKQLKDLKDAKAAADKK